MIEADEFEALVCEHVPLVGGMGIKVAEVGDGTCSILLPFRDDFLRPGGTVTGPAMFGLADVALYGAVLSRIGRVELAVTTSMTINFLRRPAPADLIAEARLLKLGRRLAYGEVLIRSSGVDEPVAHATGTYSIPPVASGN
ncbi:MAG: PaaI family thioesterase [Inquilinus sp.]|nr:PaaI family thioesterase [Inquilinus sp.]